MATTYMPRPRIFHPPSQYRTAPGVMYPLSNYRIRAAGLGQACSGATCIGGTQQCMDSDEFAQQCSMNPQTGTPGSQGCDPYDTACVMDANTQSGVCQDANSTCWPPGSTVQYNAGSQSVTVSPPSGNPVTVSTQNYSSQAAADATQDLIANPSNVTYTGPPGAGEGIPIAQIVAALPPAAQVAPTPPPAIVSSAPTPATTPSTVVQSSAPPVAPAPVAAAAPAAPFNWSSLQSDLGNAPWWVWAAGAGVLVLLFWPRR
jgi:hypothetical protein